MLLDNCLTKFPTVTGPIYDMKDVEPAMLEQLLQYAYFQDCDILKETAAAPLQFTTKNKEHSFGSAKPAAAIFSERLVRL